MAGSARDGPDLAHELEDVREQQRAISGVLRAVARRAGLQPVLEEVAEACRRLCEADHGALWLLEDGVLHVGAHHGEPEGRNTTSTIRMESIGARRPAVRPSSERPFRSQMSSTIPNTPIPARDSSERCSGSRSSSRTT
jgi:hypothetical protein